MSKFYGAVGYGSTKETVPGVFAVEITERNIYGEIFKNSKQPEKSGNLNDNIKISNQISFLADPYAQANFHNILYVKFMGTAWNVDSVTVEYPRLVLTLGGCYNE